MFNTDNRGQTSGWRIGEPFHRIKRDNQASMQFINDIALNIQQIWIRFTVPVITIYPSYFKLPQRWLHSLAPVTYWCKLQGTYSFAALMQLELFRV